MMMDYFEHDLENGLKLPIGFRFDPTDDILVNFYLTKKILGEPLPFYGLLDFDVFQTEPWKLPTGRNSFKDRKYYFFDMRNRSFKNMDTRNAGKGYWRIVENNKEVVLPSNLFVGRKNTLVYWRMQGTQAILTNWMLHEFSITTIVESIQVSCLCVYRIFKRKWENDENTNASEIDFNVENESVSTPPPSSP